MLGSTKKFVTYNFFVGYQQPYYFSSSSEEFWSYRLEIKNFYGTDKKTLKQVKIIKPKKNIHKFKKVIELNRLGMYECSKCNFVSNKPFLLRKHSKFHMLEKDFYFKCFSCKNIKLNNVKKGITHENEFH